MATIASLVVKMVADTKPFQDGVRRTKAMMEDLNRTAGKRSQLGQTFELLKGGGAVAGLALGAATLRNMTGEAEAMFTQFRNAEVSSAGLALGLAKSVPILGSLVSAGHSFFEIVTGTAARAKRMAEDMQIFEKGAQERAARIAALQEPKDQVQQLIDRFHEIEDMVNAAGNLPVGVLGDYHKEQQAIKDRILAIYDEADAHEKAAAAEKARFEANARYAADWKRRVESMTASVKHFGSEWAIALGNRAAPFIETFKQLGEAFEQRQHKAKEMYEDIKSRALAKVMAGPGPLQMVSAPGLTFRGSSEAQAMQARLIQRADQKPQMEIKQAILESKKEIEEGNRIQQEISDKLSEMGIGAF